MKVKHWAGYGTVTARHIGKIDRERNTLETFEVIGNHECGLEPRYFDYRDWERWLGKRFRVGRPSGVTTEVWWSDKDRSEHMIVTFYVSKEDEYVW